MKETGLEMTDVVEGELDKAGVSNVIPQTSGICITSELVRNANSSASSLSN